jgi:glycosyltransferase involved in cell wall biosynthesis
MKISVVIPNYNDVRIERAVASVRRQREADYELVLIDGGSTAPEVRAFYATNPADTLVIERDLGIFDALNKGVARATGDVLYLMGSDDELSGEYVFRDVARSLAEGPDLHGACIGCEFVNRSGSVIRKWYPRSVTSARIRRGLLPPHFSLFLRRSVYDIVGPFRVEERGNVACDSIWLIDLGIAIPDLRVVVLPEHHLRMDYGGASTGSVRAITSQFRAVHRYARERSASLPQWFLVSPAKTLSKVLQLRFFSR